MEDESPWVGPVDGETVNVERGATMEKIRFAGNRSKEMV